MGTGVGTYRNYVGGQWVEAAGHFDDFNPYSGELVARGPAGTRADAAAAVAAAHEAFAAWSVTPPEVRQRIFLKAADLMEARRDDLLGTLAAETGASAGSGGFQLKRAMSELRQAAGWVHQPKGELIPSDSPEATHLSTGIQLADENLARRPAPFLAPEKLERLEAVRRTYDPDGLLAAYDTKEPDAWD